MDPATLANHRQIRAISALGFLFTLHAVLPTYISSTFLSTLIGEKSVGIIYTAASILSVLAFIAINRILQRFGNFKTMQALIGLEFVAFLILAISKDPEILTGAFIFSVITGALIGFNIDLFLEQYSSNDKTGSIRGTFLSIINIAWIISQYLVSLILTDGDYWKIYAISGIILVPVWLLSLQSLRGFKDSEYRKTDFITTAKEILRDQNIYKVVMSNVILQFFYAWMVIYMPIYLHNYIGLPWNEIGIILTILLLPFVLIEAPLGFLADKKLGEKEILSIGFVIMAITTASISFIDSSSMWVWAFVLLLTRIGASMIEIMNETYFFKKTSSNDANLLSVFRMSRPIAGVIAPIIASLLLIFLPMSQLFVILGLITFYGLRYSLTIEDTK
ncbi:MAG: MFS transporter [Candidatus Paceibacterota bacterium]|jgi:MFS family permease